jgi:hypothetical protein
MDTWLEPIGLSRELRAAACLRVIVLVGLSVDAAEDAGCGMFVPSADVCGSSGLTVAS